MCDAVFFLLHLCLLLLHVQECSFQVYICCLHVYVIWPHIGFSTYHDSITTVCGFDHISVLNGRTISWYTFMGTAAESLLET